MDYLTQMMAQMNRQRQGQAPGLFDPDPNDNQQQPTRGQFLQSEKERQPFASAYQRHSNLPIGINPYSGRHEMALPAWLHPSAQRVGDGFDQTMSALGRLAQPEFDRLGSYARHASNEFDNSYRRMLGHTGGFRTEGLPPEGFPRSRPSDDIDDQTRSRINQRLGLFERALRADQPGINDQDLTRQMRAIYQREFVNGPPHSNP